MKKSYLIAIFIFAIIAAILILIFGGSAAPAKTTKVEPVKVTTQKVLVNNIPLRAYAVGTVVAPETVMMKARTDGIVTKINFKPGQFVKKGQLLVQLQSETAEANLANAQALYLKAKNTFDRYASLAKSDREAVSKETLDGYRASMNAAYATVKVNQQLLKDTRIFAPFSGFVGTTASVPNSVDGNTINNTTEVTLGAYLESGDPVVIISNPDKVWVRYQVPQEYSRYLKEGQAIEVTSSAYPKVTFKGQVDVISPVVYQSSRAFQINADINNSDHRLKSGMIVFATQTLQQNRKVLTVPGLSLVPSFTGYNVYTIKNDKVLEVPVMTGERFDTQVEIKSGLKAGDEIINSKVSDLQPGESVTVSSK